MLGAISFIVPWRTHIRPALAPLAAIGLMVIMTGATVLAGAGMGLEPALFPLVVDSIAASVAYGRRASLAYRFEVGHQSESR